MGRMGPALWFIAELYKVEDRAAAMAAAERLCLRQIESKPILDQLHGYLQKIQTEITLVQNRFDFRPSKRKALL